MKSFQIPMLSMSLLGLCLLSGLDAPPAHADFTLGNPVRTASAILPTGPRYEGIACFSSDGLEMYVESESIRPGGYLDGDLWVLRRASAEQDWGAPENLGPAINSTNIEANACMSKDGLRLYFMSDRPGGYGGWDLYMATRATKDKPWGQGVNMGPKINSSTNDHSPWESPDGLELYLTSARADGYGYGDIYVAGRATTNDPWGEPVNLGPVVNSPYGDGYVSLSPDGLLLLFSDGFSAGRQRPGGCGNADLWMARRASLSDPWQAPVNLGPKINGTPYETYPRISPDSSTLYFSRYSDGIWENWQVPIIPIVDFNGDGQADGKDVLCMASRWSTDDPLCDIGPFAWGDGTVDLQDLIVLAEYLGKEVIDPALIAHWTLDESEGTVAVDSAGGKDGYVLGDAAWQPADGQVDGALQLDGVDDFVIINPVLNPADGPFSVLAWVKGGAAGQTVISQQGGANWLSTDPLGGFLMTELAEPGRSSGPLLSETTITDGQWHRIGFVWDGSDRTLYVDSVAVAQDMQGSLESSSNGLYIGVGKAMVPGTYFSGLIDDVRIYNRVVSP
jgi:hypothetical protein